MRPIRGPRFWAGLTVVLAVATVAGLWALTVPFLRGGGTEAVASDGSVPSSSETPSGATTPTAEGDLVLDAMVLAAIGEGWVLGTAVDSDGAVTVMAIDPTGGVYPGLTLPAGSEVVGWLADDRAVVFDPATTELYAQVIAVMDGEDSPLLSFGTGWVDPEVSVAADGSAESFVVASGKRSARTLASVDLTTGVITELADAARRTALVASADGASALTAVGSTPADIVLSSSSGETSAGAPLGTTDCAPEAWDAGRQAIVVCTDDQTTVWALEPTTATYASAAVLPDAGDLALVASGSRVLVSGSVYGVDGTLRWELPQEVSDATEAAFSGTSLVLWSPDDDGMIDDIALVRDDGRLAALVGVPDGYEGFAQVLGLGPFS